MADRRTPIRPVRTTGRARVYKEGLWVVPVGSGRALIGTLRACRNPECRCRVLDVHLYPVDGRCVGVQWGEDGLKLSHESDLTHSLVDASSALAVNVDFESGEVSIDGDRTAALVDRLFGTEVKASSAPEASLAGADDAADPLRNAGEAVSAGEATAEERAVSHSASHSADANRPRGHSDFASSDMHRLYLSWIRANLDGRMLDTLAACWYRIKAGRPYRRRIFPGFEPAGCGSGALVSFAGVFGGLRRDVYLIDGQSYEVLDLHCMDPTCVCEDSMVEVLGPEEREVGSVLARPGGRVEFDAQGDQRGLLERVWGLFCARYDAIARLRARRDQMKEAGKEFGSELTPPAGSTRQLEAVADHAPPHSVCPSSEPAAPRNGPAGSRRPGRNDPCLCGSGRKYKRCCMQ